MNCGSAGQHSQAAAGRVQQSSVCALPHACRRSSGAVRVLDVRIDWHVKRPTSSKVKRRAVQSQAGGGLAGRRQQIECTQLQLSGSARTVGSVVVLPTPADPMGFRKSTRDVEAQGAAKEHTSEARGGGRGPGVRGLGAGLRQRWLCRHTASNPITTEMQTSGLFRFCCDLNASSPRKQPKTKIWLVERFTKTSQSKV